MSKVLAIDDDLGFLRSLESLLKYKKIEVDTIQNPLDAEELSKRNCYDCILLDVEMPEMNRFDLLRKFNEICPSTPLIMISGKSGIPDAVQAIKCGAYDFIEKPLEAERLLIAIQNATNKKILLEDKQNLINDLSPFYHMTGESVAHRSLLQIIQKYAPTDIKTLILGETGVGKELVAGAIHYNSKRAGKPFIKINCAAIPGELLESELFGHSKGSYTNAISDYEGKFLRANGGTLFLDEIGDMELLLQAKLLRVLESGEVEPVGSATPKKVDVRVVTASNKNLNTMIETGKFRKDLFHRINALTITVPPLREKKEDIPLLSRFFLHEFAKIYNKRLVDITPDAMDMLIAYDYPGNIRELKNMIENVAILTNNVIIDHDDLLQAFPILRSFSLLPMQNSLLESATDHFERDYIIQKLTENNWKIVRTASELGIDRTSLFKKMKKLGITKPKGH